MLLLATILMLSSPAEASASTAVTLRIRPSEIIKVTNAYNKYDPGVKLTTAKLADGAFRSMIFNDQPGARFIDGIEIDAGEYMGNVYITNPEYFSQVSDFGGCLYMSQWIYNSETGRSISGSATLRLILPPCENSDDRKWRIREINLRALNIRNARNKKDYTNSTNKEYANPCEISVNGKTIALDEDDAVQSHSIMFEDDEQRMSEIVLHTKTDAAVGLTRVTVYIEDEDGQSGFLSSDPGESRLGYNDAGIYSLPPCRDMGNLTGSDFSLAILNADRERMALECAYDSECGKFRITPCGADASESAGQSNAPSNDSPLDEGRYYACYYVGEEPSDISAGWGIPFEIMPVAEGLSLNESEIRFHNGGYVCNPAALTGEGDTWSNAAISGCRPGTSIYWKLLTEAEAKEMKRMVSEIRMNAGADELNDMIPEGFTILTDSGIDISDNGSRNESGGYLGLILRRNGVTSDPYVIRYDKSDISSSATGIQSTILRTEYYTMQGIRTEISGCREGEILLRIDRMTDGTIRKRKIRSKTSDAFHDSPTEQPDSH